MIAPASQHPTLVVGVDPATGEQFALASAGGGGSEGGATEVTLDAINDKTPALGQTTKAGSTPVTLASDQGALSVAEAQSTTVVEGTVAVDTTVDQVVAADASRRRLIVTNNHASVKLGLSTNAAATFASCAIQLAAGEMWVEALAANKAWYAIFDTGGSATVPYQTVV